MISHRNCVPQSWYCGEVLRVTPHDRKLREQAVAELAISRS